MADPSMTADSAAAARQKLDGQDLESPKFKLDGHHYRIERLPWREARRVTDTIRQVVPRLNIDPAGDVGNQIAAIFFVLTTAELRDIEDTLYEGVHVRVRAKDGSLGGEHQLTPEMQDVVFAENPLNSYVVSYRAFAVNFSKGLLDLLSLAAGAASPSASSPSAPPA